MHQDKLKFFLAGFCCGLAWSFLPGLVVRDRGLSWREFGKGVVITCGMLTLYLFMRKRIAPRTAEASPFGIVPFFLFALGFSSAYLAYILSAIFAFRMEMPG